MAAVSNSHPDDGKVDGKVSPTTVVSSAPILGRRIQDDYAMPLAEIFEVRLLEIHGKQSVSIHGKLDIESGGGPVRIFDRPDETCAHRIRSKEPIPIQAPWRAISGLSDVVLRIKLKEGQKKFIKDIIYFDPSRDKHNRVLIKRSVGIGGSLVMKLAVYESAVVATIEIKLISGKSSQEKSRLYGRIAVSNSLLPKMETLLFNKKCGDHIELACGDSIPLCRSVKPVPDDESLQIQVRLYDLSGGYFLTGNKSFVSPKYACDVVEYIDGKHGQRIEVKVTWDDYLSHF
ncbi:rRNA N-glycosidase [Rhynchospora pubera]|uniref:rRNA N-glycosidase n=1 Tax=Rhynchospora pubera TaxID=906938 RepID=A0AAV8ECW4_9POAL|nr:rRNA N-glycosidase [Rhynchospora pubera]